MVTYDPFCYGLFTGIYLYNQGQDAYAITEIYKAIISNKFTVEQIFEIAKNMDIPDDRFSNAWQFAQNNCS